jgi:hypothetical protein
MLRALGLYLVVMAAACVGPPDEPGPGGPGAGGKADDVRDCEEGRTCLAWSRYDVVFTNPLCQLYEYDEPVPTADGSELLTAKPKNVYCAAEHDSEPSGARPGSPQSRLVDWIESTGRGDRIFIATLSFSNPVVFDALCATEAEVVMVLDKVTALGERLRTECGAGKQVLQRGSTGSVGFAHVKLVVINPDGAGPSDPDEDVVRLAFGSGNMSTGTHLHHENWHFLEVARDSYFVENHRCLIDALIHEPSTAGKGAFREALASCRAHIDHPEEDDMRAFFIPALEDRRAAAGVMLAGVDAAGSLEVAVHRFGHRGLVDAMAARLARREPGFAIRLVADDDLYWLRPLVGPGRQVGLNLEFEADLIDQLEAADGEDDGRIDRFSTGGFQVKYLETRHASFHLHHNKFILYDRMPGRDAVLCGAANLTRAGFEDKLENIYYLEIPHVVDAFRTQFGRFWDGQRLPGDEQDPPRATAPDKMPALDIPL